MKVSATALAVLVDDVLRDPTTSHWLRHALTWALERDPVDVAADVEVLYMLLQARLQELQNADSSFL